MVQEGVRIKGGYIFQNSKLFIIFLIYYFIAMADVMYTEHSRHKQLRHTTILLYFCQTGKTKTNHYIDWDNNM